MSKAEERGLEKYPYAEICREKYIEGYHQAEKDNGLTWEDVMEICTQSVLVEFDFVSHKDIVLIGCFFC